MVATGRAYFSDYGHVCVLVVVGIEIIQLQHSRNEVVDDEDLLQG
jgi:hypothetical protein